MVEHTPGPWGYQSHDWRGSQSEYDWYIIGDISEGEDGPSAVGVAIVKGNATAGDIPLANARLIAAAPDLLAACEAAVEQDRRYWEEAGQAPGRSPECQPIYEEMVRAIARAKGGAA